MMLVRGKISMPILWGFGRKFGTEFDGNGGNQETGRGAWAVAC